MKGRTVNFFIEPEALPESMLQRDTAAPMLGGDFSLEELERRHILVNVMDAD